MYSRIYEIASLIKFARKDITTQSHYAAGKPAYADIFLRRLLVEGNLWQERFRLHERAGRLLGDEAFLERVEKLVCRFLKWQKPGYKMKNSLVRYSNFLRHQRKQFFRREATKLLERRVRL